MRRSSQGTAASFQPCLCLYLLKVCACLKLQSKVVLLRASFYALVRGKGCGCKHRFSQSHSYKSLFVRTIRKAIAKLVPKADSHTHQ